MRRALQPRHRQARVVAGQLQTCRTISQLLLPVGQLGGGGISLQPFLLPQRKLRKLHGQLRQRRGLTAREGLIQAGEFAQAHPHGPSIADDAVHTQQQYVLLGSQLQEGGPHKWPLAQIKGPLRFLCR